MTATTTLMRVDEQAPVIRRKHPGWWIAGVIVVALAVLLVSSLATNKALSWGVFAQYLFSGQIVKGLLVTIELSIGSFVVATIIGFVMAALAQSANPVLRRAARVYIGFFRGLPLLVLLLITFNAAIFLPTITLGIPHLFGPTYSTNAVITSFSASIIGLALHESAFIAEIIRGGILAVPKGQTEAALSVGMRPRQATLTIVYPQAVRIIVPTMTNQFIMLMKASSMVAVIGGGDLLTIAQRIYGSTFETIPLLFVVCFWYLVLVAVATVGQTFLERRLSRSVAGATRTKTAFTALESA